MQRQTCVYVYLVPVIDLILYFLPIIGLNKKRVMTIFQRILLSPLPLFRLTDAINRLKSQEFVT
jgi:hypothetical protein